MYKNTTALLPYEEYTDSGNLSNRFQTRTNGIVFNKSYNFVCHARRKIDKTSYKAPFDLHDITHHITHYEATTGRELLDIDTEAFTNYLTIRSNPMKTKTENKIRMITNMYNIIENPYYEVYKWDSSDRFYKPMSTCSG